MARAAKQPADAGEPPTDPEASPLREVLAAAVREVRELRGQVDALRAELKLALQEVGELRRAARSPDSNFTPPAPSLSDSGTRRSDEARRKVRNVLDQMADIHDTATRTDPPPVG